MKKLLLTFLCIIIIEPMVSASSSEEEAATFDRGVGKMNSVFIPKGYMGGGLSFSYKTYDLGNGADDAGYSALFSLLSGVKGSLQTYGVAPSFSYFIKDNLSIGARFDYDRTELGLNTLGLSLGDLASFDLNDFHFLKNSYSGAVTARYYMPIANSRRIAMFGELRLGCDIGQSVSYQVVNGRNQGTFQDIYGAALNVVPGLCVFATNEVCVEVAVGILGLSYQYIRQETNKVDVSVMQQSGANFRINPLSINLGLSFYLPVVSKKNGGDRK